MIELQAGARYRGDSRTITDAEIALLPAMMGAINPLFHDDLAARANPAGRRILYGPALLGIVIAGTEHLLRSRVLGLVSVTDLRFRHPVGCGDTVTPTLTIRQVISKPEKAGDLLLTHDEAHNQDGTLVLDFVRAIMVRRSTS
ncbi:MaoC/PaaZ C-terminal domain-containing protein [Sporichthya sp.]|uniref:MaoC family dehydratase n=1 Tax=Sporichthya sp. TaxID=65475 RepID=UPI0017FE832F|nr:MaoC/PaaZ C-terminal domain-containing protein [Sporichthya sp.]MBA3741971.1 hypothetical protein [Sporichthya sp.]